MVFISKILVSCYPDARGIKLRERTEGMSACGLPPFFISFSFLTCKLLGLGFRVAVSRVAKMDLSLR